MKILYLLCTEDTSVGHVTRSQIKALKNNFPSLNIKVAVINGKNHPKYHDIDNYRRATKHRVFNYLGAFYFVYKLKKSFEPNITISNLSSVNAYNALCNVDDLKVGIFHSPNSQFKSLTFISRWMNILFIKLIIKKLNLLIGISSEVVNDLKITTGHPRIELCYNIHEIDEIKKYLIPPISIMRGFELICLGNVDRNKNQLLLLHTLLKLPDSIKLKIFGNIIDNSYYLKLIDFVEKNNLHERVMFCDFVSPCFEQLSKSHLLVSSSFSEGLPGTIIESLLLNRPVVSSNSSLGVSEIFNLKKRIKDNLTFTPFGVIVQITGDLQIDSNNFASAIHQVATNYEDFLNFNFEFSNKISPIENGNYFFSVLMNAYDSIN
jgi:glycosyltransferase involved in cell wall biosynthesis